MLDGAPAPIARGEGGVISKAELIRNRLRGLRVLDIGGSDYGQANAYERELKAAWSVARARVTMDAAPTADVRVNLDALPLPAAPEGPFDVATAFDVIEHLEHPADVLRWIPAPRLLVTLPNGLSPLARRMEERGGFGHLYSFTPYTASVLLRRGGWEIERTQFTLGKWSLAGKLMHAAGVLAPAWVATGIALECRRAA